MVIIGRSELDISQCCNVEVHVYKEHGGGRYSAGTLYIKFSDISKVFPNTPIVEQNKLPTGVDYVFGDST